MNHAEYRLCAEMNFCKNLDLTVYSCAYNELNLSKKVYINQCVFRFCFYGDSQMNCGLVLTLAGKSHVVCCLFSTKVPESGE